MLLCYSFPNNTEWHEPLTYLFKDIIPFLCVKVKLNTFDMFMSMAKENLQYKSNVFSMNKSFAPT